MLCVSPSKLTRCAVTVYPLAFASYFSLNRQPTNHLDVDAIDWLEKLLAERSLTFVCVTHDRYFLENVCEEIIELDSAKLYRWEKDSLELDR